MYTFVSILILIVSVLLGLIVLVQNPKGGGLAANFSGGTQFMGARQTADFLEKASWTLAVILLVLSLTATMVVPRAVSNQGGQDTELRNKIDNTQTQQPIDFQSPPTKSQKPASKPENKTK